MEKMWFVHVEKHFPGKGWKKYYRRIILYTLSVNLGLKPSFMWDFGPGPIIPGHISNFIQDLKQSGLVSDEITVISVSDNIFVSNVSNLLNSLRGNALVMDVTAEQSKWVLCERSEFLASVTDRMVQKFKGNLGGGMVSLEMGSDDCLPAVFGLLLGYPLIYYFKQKYQTLSLSLKLYTIKCKFKFSDISENFLIYSFSIPEDLVSPVVESTVDRWFERLNNVNKSMHEELQLEHRLEYVNSLNL